MQRERRALLEPRLPTYVQRLAGLQMLPARPRCGLLVPLQVQINDPKSSQR